MRSNLPAALARLLRRQQTDAEQRLWAILRNRQVNGIKFRRQQRSGDYIVDFISFSHNLIIEVDGGQHAENSVADYDTERTMYLESKGYRVLRFWNNEVLSNPDGVWHTIAQALRR